MFQLHMRVNRPKAVAIHKETKESMCLRKNN